MSNKSALVLAAAISAGLVISPSMAANHTDVGYVYEVFGPNSAFVLQRGDSTLQPAVGTRLQAGDKLSLVPKYCANKACRLLINLGSKHQRQQLDGGNNSFTVPNISDPPRLPRNVLDMLTNWFSELNLIDSQTVDLSSRGEGKASNLPLMLPLLVDNTLLVAGKRSLSFRWQGGQAPYGITLTQEDGNKTVLARDNLGQSNVNDITLNLSAGEYRLQLSDAQQASVSGTITVVSADDRNPQVRTLLETDLPDALRDTLIASLIVSQEKQAWYLEADQLLRPHVGSYSAARQVAEDLWERALP